MAASRKSWFESKHAASTLDFERYAVLVNVVVDAPVRTPNTISAIWEVTEPQLAIVRLHSRNDATWNPLPVVLVLACSWDENWGMADLLHPPGASPPPWTFATRLYGIAHCLVDRDGRVIGTSLPLANGPLMAQAPAMIALLRELLDESSVSARDVRERVATVPVEFRESLARHYLAQPLAALLCKQPGFPRGQGYPLSFGRGTSMGQYPRQAAYKTPTSR